MDKETVDMINAIRVSMQDAYNITKVLERLACHGDDMDSESKQLYWDIMYDCAKNIRLRLEEYSCGYTSVDPFEIDT